MIKKHKILFFFLILSCFTSDELWSQVITPRDLYGTWKVRDLLYLQMIGNETSADYKDRMGIYHRCLKAKVKIDSNGIKVLPGAAQFELLDGKEQQVGLFMVNIMNMQGMMGVVAQIFNVRYI
jgi:hypothetical protein